jgi:hypothetical protein
MKLKTLPFLKHKTYLFSFMLVMLGSILSSMPAYSQVDYYYGINKKGIRLGIGVGAGALQSYWTTSSIGASGRLNLDYDINLYTSIGIEGTYGMLGGEDNKTKAKLHFAKDAVTYSGGSLGFKVAVGQFSNFETINKLQEALKRLYFGAGIGMVQSTVDLTPYGGADYPGPGPALVTSSSNGVIAKNVTQKGSANPKHYQGNNGYPFVPLNIGTYIALRGLLGNDKLELNPNFQYNLVLDPLFDGYEPNSKDIPAIPGSLAYAKTANPAYGIFSIGLRYKF